MNEETERADWSEQKAYERGRRDMLHELYASLEDLLPEGSDDFESFTPSLLRRLWVMKSSIEFHYENDPETLRLARFDAWQEGESDGRWNCEHAAMIEGGYREPIVNPYLEVGA